MPVFAEQQLKFLPPLIDRLRLRGEDRTGWRWRIEVWWSGRCAAWPGIAMRGVRRRRRVLGRIRRQKTTEVSQRELETMARRSKRRRSTESWSFERSRVSRRASGGMKWRKKWDAKRGRASPAGGGRWGKKPEGKAWGCCGLASRVLPSVLGASWQSAIVAEARAGTGGLFAQKRALSCPPSEFSYLILQSTRQASAGFSKCRDIQEQRFDNCQNVKWPELVPISNSRPNNVPSLSVLSSRALAICPPLPGLPARRRQKAGKLPSWTEGWGAVESSTIANPTSWSGGFCSLRSGAEGDQQARRVAAGPSEPTVASAPSDGIIDGHAIQPDQPRRRQVPA